MWQELPKSRSEPVTLDTPFRPPSRYEVPGKLRPDAVTACHSALEFHGVANQVFQTVYYFSARPRADVVFEGVTYHYVHPVAQLARARRFDFQVETGPNKVRPPDLASLFRGTVELKTTQFYY